MLSSQHNPCIRIVHFRILRKLSNCTTNRSILQIRLWNSLFHMAYQHCPPTIWLRAMLLWPPATITSGVSINIITVFFLHTGRCKIFIWLEYMFALGYQFPAFLYLNHPLWLYIKFILSQFWVDCIKTKYFSVKSIFFLWDELDSQSNYLHRKYIYLPALWGFEFL